MSVYLRVRVSQLIFWISAIVLNSLTSLQSGREHLDSSVVSVKANKLVCQLDGFNSDRLISRLTTDIARQDWPVPSHPLTLFFSLLHFWRVPYNSSTLIPTLIPCRWAYVQPVNTACFLFYSSFLFFFLYCSIFFLPSFHKHLFIIWYFLFFYLSPTPFPASSFYIHPPFSFFRFFFVLQQYPLFSLLSFLIFHVLFFLLTPCFFLSS